MLLSNLINREIGLKEYLHDIYAEKCVSNLRCHSQNVFSCTSKEFVNNGLEVPPFVAKFSPLSIEKEVLLVASEEGEIFVHDNFNSNNNGPSTKINAHDNAIFDVCWMNEASSFVTVSGDKTAALWNLQTGTKISQFSGHQGSIKTVDVRPEDNAVFATGGREGNIMLWDTRSVGRNQSCYVVNVLRDVHNISETTISKRTKCRARNETYNGVTSVLFQDNNTLISAGAKDGDVKFWDIRRTYSAYRNVPLPYKKIPYSGNSIKQQGFSSLTLDTNGCRLFASCTDNIIYEYNCSTCKLINKYSGHRNSSFYVKSTLSPQNNYLLSGSSDECAYIWKVGGSENPIFRLNGHSDEVTSVDWSKSDNSKIVTCCDDMKYRIWTNGINETDNQMVGQVERVTKPVLNPSSSCKTPKNFVGIPCPSGPAFPIYQSPLRDIKLDFNRQNSSPTINLPNLILDKQITPINFTTRSTPRRPSNWLTKITDSHKSKHTNVSRSAQKLKKCRSRTRIDKCLENYFNFI